MSGIYAVLYTEGRDPGWSSQLERLVRLSKQRGNDGSSSRVLTTAGSFTKSRTGHIYSPSDSGVERDYRGIIGCAYSRPISLDEADDGPFVSELGTSAITYDGVVTGYTGMSLLKYLVDGEFTQKQNWSELTGELRGQFGLLAMSGSMQRIYYAVKAKPLYLLFDSLNRGIVVASSREALNGLYHPVRNPQPVELEPYSSGVISPDGILEKFSRSLVQGAGSIVLSGGGLDSLVAAYNTRINHPDEPLSLLYFDYLAKAGRKEVEATRAIGEGVIGLTGTGAVSCHFFDGAVLTALADSSLTGSREISHGPVSGHASEWVPARNTVLMSLAIAFAEQNGFARIITGINQDAATAYPDNDEEWLLRMQQVVPFAVASGQSIALEAPLVRMSKVEIVKHGKKLGIPWKDVRSWSCYEEGERHCGECSSCSARRKAFKLARVADPTEYAK